MSFWKNLLKSTMFLMFFCIPQVQAAQGEILTVNPMALSAWLVQQKTLLVDVRDYATFIQEHILGAINVSYSQAKSTTAFVGDRTIVLYCGNDTCPTSRLAAQDLINAGHKNVYVLEGGLEKWKQSYPTEGTSVLAQNSAPAAL